MGGLPRGAYLPVNPMHDVHKTLNHPRTVSKPPCVSPQPKLPTLSASSGSHAQRRIASATRFMSPAPSA